MTFEMSKIEKFRLWFKYIVFEPVRDWILQIIFCHHNARVIIDFEHRMSVVLCEATNNLMSKSYYDAETMCCYIRETQQQYYEDGYNDAKIEYGIDDEDELAQEDEEQELYMCPHCYVVTGRPTDMSEKLANALRRYGKITNWEFGDVVKKALAEYDAAKEAVK